MLAVVTPETLARKRRLFIFNPFVEVLLNCFRCRLALAAVKICSQVLDACIWFSFDPDFKPDDDEPLAVFYDHEVQFLRNKTVEQLKEIHQWKLTVGSGARIRQ
jgi:hypothetical protein